MKTVTVKIGDVSINIPPLTIGQLERVADWLQDGFEQEQGQRTMKTAFVHNRRLLVIGFERSTPPLTNEQLDAMEATVQDVAAAVTAILQVAGLAPTEAASDPEAAAPGGASPSSLIGSSASSPPAAGTLPN